ncbi:hypothetical protein EVAR_88615_1 [Eumeta japonica]|uniref:Uncharacterized protein n=1 Tax=Eumeta variegata TaxID=151549 RepID=A0A4C1WZL5_EUMVA|nr:hypothetical protein EVAR_88615_1 [Eumeta japonica]
MASLNSLLASRATRTRPAAEPESKSGPYSSVWTKHGPNETEQMNRVRSGAGAAARDKRARTRAHTFDPTLVFDPRPVPRFGAGLAFDSEPGAVLDSAFHSAFNSDSTHDSFAVRRP